MSKFRKSIILIIVVTFLNTITFMNWGTQLVLSQANANEKTPEIYYFPDDSSESNEVTSKENIYDGNRKRKWIYILGTLGAAAIIGIAAAIAGGGGGGDGSGSSDDDQEGDDTVVINW
jgi:hypothetical protein